MSFDGNDYIKISDSNSFKSNEITLAGWINTNKAKWQGIYSIGSKNDDRFIVQTTDQGKLRIYNDILGALLD